MNFRILRLAEREVREAVRWYNKKQPGTGARFVHQLSLTIERIRQHPESFPIVDWVRTTKDIRFAIVKVFPYHVVFEIATNEVLVLAVAQSNRRPAYWRRRLGK